MHLNLSRCIPALALILVFFLGCNKSEDTYATNDGKIAFSIDEAKKLDFKRQFENSVLNDAQNNVKSRKIKRVTPLWDKALVSENDEQEIIECPVQFDATPGFRISKDNNEPNLPISGLTRLVLLKDKKTKEEQTVLMHLVPQNGATTEGITYTKRNGFSGYVFYTTLEGIFINGWFYENGKITKESKVADDPLVGINAPADEQPCLTTVTYWYERTCYSYSCSDWVYIGSTSQTYCSTSGDDYAGGGGGGVITVRKEKIESQPDNVDGASDICPNSVKFKKVINLGSDGTGGWQVAGLNNIHLNIVDLVTRKIVPLRIPLMYFGLPVIRASGEFYSASAAADLVARAVNAAENAVMNRYHSLGGSLDAVGMSLYYRQKLNEEMKKNGGSASLSPGTNITIVPTDAVYSGIGGLNCLF